MIDIILVADSKQTLVNWAKAHPPGNELWQAYETEDEEGNPVVGYKAREGIEWFWWNETGNFPTNIDNTDPENPVYTYYPGVVIKLRIHGNLFFQDKLEPASNIEEPDEWHKSKIARYVRNNGTPGTIAGINYYEIDGVRLFRYRDVEQFLIDRNLPNHIWL